MHLTRIPRESRQRARAHAIRRRTGNGSLS
jgi:hypothetical protein